MKTDEVDLFRTLEPPPGGVERFRRRLEDADAAARETGASREPARPMLAAGLAAMLLVVVMLAVIQTPRSGDGPSDGDAGPPIVTNPAPAEIDAPDAAGDEATGTAVAAEFRSAPAFARLLGQPLRPAETSISIGDTQVAVSEVPTANSKIRIYQIRDN